MGDLDILTDETIEGGQRDWMEGHREEDQYQDAQSVSFVVVGV